MSCKYLDKVCAKCGHKNEILTYYYDDTTDERRYKHFVDFHLYECDECGYMAEDISTDPQNLNEVKKTSEYVNAYKYAYLNLDTIKANHGIFESYPANVYECYAIYQKSLNNLDKFVQSMFACIRQKKAILGKLISELEEYDDGMTKEEIESNKDMQLHISISYKQNAEDIISAYQSTTKSKFLTTIYIECLVLLKRIEEAVKCYEELKPNIDFSLQERIDKILEEV